MIFCNWTWYESWSTLLNRIRMHRLLNNMKYKNKQTWKLITNNKYSSQIHLYLKKLIISRFFFSTRTFTFFFLSFSLDSGGSCEGIIFRFNLGIVSVYLCGWQPSKDELTDKQFDSIMIWINFNQTISLCLLRGFGRNFRSSEILKCVICNAHIMKREL